MLYEAKLSPSEVGLLAGLIGEQFDAVVTNHWSVELYAATKVVVFTPRDVATQDAAHPAGDVDRPAVAVREPSVLSEDDEIVLQSLGVIRRINLVSTLAGFSDVVDCPEEEIAPGVVLPAGRGYDQVYFPVRLLDEDGARLRASDDARVDFDCAVEIVADGCSSLVLYTQLHFVSVSIDGLPAHEPWAESGYYRRRAVEQSR